MKLVLLLCTAIILNIITIELHAQNLVPNPSFEDMMACPGNGTSAVLPFPGTPSVATHWYKPTGGTTDYFNACATGTAGVSGNGVPANFAGYQFARTGDAYIGGHVFIDDGRDYSEYLQAKLTSPLVAGRQYYVSFWVSLAGDFRYQGFAIDKLGAYFGQGYMARGGGTYLNLTPQVQHTPGDYLDDTKNWVQVSGTFTASGGEDNIIIGNFGPTTSNNYIKRGSANNAYYYFDDVCVFDLTDAYSVHDTTICASTLNVALVGRNTFKHFEWNTGDTTLAIAVEKEGVYWVKSFSECSFSVDTFIIHHDPIPDFSLGKDTVICDGSPIEFKVPFISGMSYLWQDGTSGNSYKATKTGVYAVKIFNDKCSASDSIEIIIDDFSQDLGEDVNLLCNGSEQEVKLQAAVPDGADVKWSTGSWASSIIVRDSGVYWVVVKSALCLGSDTVRIDIEKCNCHFDIPSAFSPNNDGLNDIFSPLIGSDCPVDNYKMVIYNRYGQLIYMSTNPAKTGWDGTYNGAPVDMGTYFYRVTIESRARKREYTKKGDVLLVR